jgi:hypothetical protein
MRLDNVSPISQADWLVTIEGLVGYFSSLTGGDIKISRPQYSDGLVALKRTAKTGVTEFSNVILKKAFDPAADAPVIAFCLDKEDGSECSITARSVIRGKALKYNTDKAIQFSGAKLVAWNFPGGIDLLGGGTKVSELTLEFAVDGRSYS